MAYPSSITTERPQSALVQARNHQTQPAAKWLACSSAHQHYLFALEHTGEVIRGATVTKVPFTQTWFCGLISLRGKLLGVIDLPDFLALNGTDSPHESLGLQQRANEQNDFILIVGSALEIPCGLAVGKLEGLRSDDDFTHISAGSAANGPLVNDIYHDKTGSRWLAVNLIALVRSLKKDNIGRAQATL